MFNYITLAKKLYPIHRSLTGKGVIKTLNIIKEKTTKNLKIRKVKSKTKVFDWRVPNEWNCSDAYVLDKNQKKIINLKKSNLHLVSYSQPISKYVTRDELFKRLHFLKNQPRAIPYVTSYYNKYWGFCLSYEDYKMLKKNYTRNDIFFVKINTSFNPSGFMNYGELLIKGREKKEILISTNICHPSMVNNELSGPVVAAALINHFKNKKLNRSLRFLFLPETIGSIAYINKNLKNLKKNVIGGYHLSCIGDERNYSYVMSKYSDSISDKVVFQVFKKLKLNFNKYSFIKSESDERRFNSPHVDLGIGCISRTKYHSYPEYHTSLDNFDVVTNRGLKGGFQIVKECINQLLNKKLNKKTKRVKIKKYPLSKYICEPNLGKRKLYPKISEKNNNFKNPHLILDFLQYSDGTNSLEAISSYLGKKISDIKKIQNLLIRKRLIRNYK